MRSNADKKKFLEILEEAPWIEIAAKRVGIHRSTPYRWMERSAKFNEAVERALERGRRGECSFAKAKLHVLVGKENIQAIKLLLENNDPQYMKPRREIDPMDAELARQTEKLKLLFEEVMRHPEKDV